MFVSNFIARKLASLLQPWLLQQPELELNLGFLRCHAVAKNLHFNTIPLNELLDDSASFYFTDFSIDRLVLKVSNWSAPAFNWEVQGFHVSVSPRVGKDNGRNRDPSEVLLEEKKKILYEIDPEGSALYDMMEKLVNISSSRSQKTSLPNLILSHCSLQMTDINLLLNHSVSDASFECLCKIEELNVDSRLVKPQCFLKEYINSVFVYSKESYFDLEIRGLKVSLKRHHPVYSAVCSVTDIICSLKLNGFQLNELNCSIEELVFSLSPTDVSTISVIMRELTREPVSIRNGKQLWKETTTRIRSLISTRRWSLYKLVSVVCLWLRYVRAWEKLYSLAGYPMDNTFKKSIDNISKNPMFVRTFTCQWEVISEIEKELPAPGIALARRVVRCRTVEKVFPSEEEIPVSKYLGYFRYIFQLFGLIWSALCSIFFMRRNRVLPEDSCPHHCYRLNLGRISISISPDDTVPSVSDWRVSHLDLLSFFITFDTFILLYDENICEDHLTFSCGNFNVKSLSSTHKYEYSSKARKKPDVLDSKSILCSKPAIYSEIVTLPLLESLLDQMWLDWKFSSAEFEKNNGDEHLNNPFILCEIKHSLTGVNSSLSYRSSKYCLAVGQLDFFLGYSSVLSLTILFRKINDAFSAPVSSQMAVVHTSTQRVWDYHSCIAEMQKAVQKVLPERLIQVGIYVVGPQIKLSLRKDILREAVDDIDILFDCKNIELIMSPNNLASSSILLNYETPEGTHLKELNIVNLAKSDNGSYQCQGELMFNSTLKIHGISAYLDDSHELQQSQISLKPITIQLSTVRKDSWSFGESVSAFSAVLRGNALGFSGLIFADELSVLVEVVNGLMFALSRTFNKTNSSSSVNAHKLNSQETFDAGFENELLVTTSTETSLVIQSTLYALKCSFEIHSVDIIIHKSREVIAQENQVTVSESFMNQNLSVHFLPDNGIQTTFQKVQMDFSYENQKCKMDWVADCLGLRVVIFRFEKDVMNCSLLPQAQDVCELSVSNCTFNLSLTYLPSGSTTNESNISHSIHARVSSTEVYLVGCPLKDVIGAKHQSSKLDISHSVDGGC